MTRRASYRWRKRNTTRAEHVSTYPANVWLIRRTADKQAWDVLRAAHDGDEYKIALSGRSDAGVG
jgi:hypothetical protein